MARAAEESKTDSGSLRPRPERKPSSKSLRQTAAWKIDYATRFFSWSGGFSRFLDSRETCLFPAPIVDSAVSSSFRRFWASRCLSEYVGLYFITYFLSGL